MANVKKVTSPSTGETGWVATYGAPDFGGVRVSAFRTREAALNADVSDDVGDHVIDRRINRSMAALKYWGLE
jgi:hypothetical protein